MEVRVDHQVAVAGGEAGHRHPVVGDAQRSAVGLHYALRGTGGPRRKQDVRWVVVANRGGASYGLGPRLGGGPPEESFPGNRLLRHRTLRHDDGLEVGQLHATPVEHGEVVGTKEVSDGHQRAGAA